MRKACVVDRTAQERAEKKIRGGGVGGGRAGVLRGRRAGAQGVRGVADLGCWLVLPVPCSLFLAAGEVWSMVDRSTSFAVVCSSHHQLLLSHCLLSITELDYVW